jgi:hypothetical protein
MNSDWPGARLSLRDEWADAIFSGCHNFYMGGSIRAGWPMNRFTFFFIIAFISAIPYGCGGANSMPPPGMPSLSISQSSLSFSATQGSATNPSPASVNVSNAGEGTLTFAASSDSPWLSVTPMTGTAPATLQISAVVGALAPSVNTGHITITANDASGSPATITVGFLVAPLPSDSPFWPQWGSNPQHTGLVNIAGQPAAHILANIVYDPFVAKEQAENPLGDLLVHYQAPLVDGNDTYMVTKTGTYNSCSPPGAWESGSACGPNTWNSMIWNEARFSWIGNQLVMIWGFQSDWKPETNGSALNAWEPVFHPAEANGFIYVPGAGGTIWKVEKVNGTAVSHINPFSGVTINVENTYVAGPLTADSQGNIYYNVVELASATSGDPWAANDVQGAWLVKVGSNDSTNFATYASLVPGAPAGSSNACPSGFSRNANGLCGSQRPGINVAPAVAPDGTIYVASLAHFNDAQAYVVAVNSNLTPKWASSLRNFPVCGAAPCINPSLTLYIADEASSSPTVLPDGSVLFGVLSNDGTSRGELLKLDSSGNLLATYNFGWDTTPAVYPNNGTYSVILKDNHYATSGPYYITQLDSNLQIQWQFQNTNTKLPDGFEWCINMPAVDVNGNVYANSEDGNVYVIPQGHTGIFSSPASLIFLNSAIGAAYTPLSIGPDGKLYTQNDGHLFVVGN